MSSTNHSIGSTIAALRKENGWTQAELAEKISVSDKAVSKWEMDSGTPNLESVIALSNIFGVTIDYLLKGDETDAEPDENMTIEDACKKDSTAILVRETSAIIGKDENGLTILDYMLKYNCKRLVKAFFGRFPVEKIFNDSYYELYDTDKIDKTKIVKVLVEYLMIDELESLKVFYQHLMPNGRNGYLNIYTEGYIGRILVGEKFKGKFYDTYLEYFGEREYRIALTFAAKNNNEELFKMLWKRVMEIDNDYCAAESRASVTRGVSVAYTVVNGEAKKNEHFLVNPTQELLDIMLKFGYVDELKELNALAQKYRDEPAVSETELALAELKKKGKGNSFEAVRLSVMDGNILNLEKLTKIKDYDTAKKLLFSEPIHEFEYICRLLDEKKYRELFRFSIDDQWHMKDIIAVPEPDHKQIISSTFGRLRESSYDRYDCQIRHYSLARGVNREQFKKWAYFNDGYGSSPDRRFDIKTPEDALKAIQTVREDFFKPWEREREKQEMKKVLARDYPRSDIEKLIAEGNSRAERMALMDLCALLEAFLKMEYESEAGLEELITTYCKGHNTDDKTRDVLHRLRMRRNAVAHLGAEGALLSKSELKFCIDFIYKMGE